MRLTLIASRLLSLPLVMFADMEPKGIGVMTAYIVPSLVVLFFFVLMLDALMNRVFMIEQPPRGAGGRRGSGMLAGLFRRWRSPPVSSIWGPYFRTPATRCETAD